MFRQTVLAWTLTTSLTVSCLVPCMAADGLVNKPYDNSGFVTAWTYRTGPASNRRAFAMRIEGTVNDNLQAKLSLYKVEEIEGASYFKKSKIKAGATTATPQFTVDCVLEPLPAPKIGYKIKVPSQSNAYIGLISASSDSKFAMVQWKDNVYFDGDTTPIVSDPCEQPPEIGEEELVAIGSTNSTPGPSLPMNRTPRPDPITEDPTLP
jgi:hypothetical protein